MTTIDLRIAAAYIRVSTDDQVELSPASQLVEIRKWASRNGYIVPDEFVFMDEGISGRGVKKRDEFRRMIDRLRDAYLTGADTVEEYKASKAAVQQRIADLDAQIAAMQKEDRAAADPKLLRSALRAVVKTLESPDTTVAEKNAAVRSVADNITWNKAANTLTIHYRLVL